MIIYMKVTFQAEGWAWAGIFDFVAQQSTFGLVDLFRRECRTVIIITLSLMEPQ